MKYLMTLLNIQAMEDDQNSIEKPEGICTNLESIKEYLENLVTFVLGNFI